MNTYLHCIPCLFEQIEKSAAHFNLSDEQAKAIMDDVGSSLKDTPLTASPPERAVILQHMISSLLNTDDPYKEIKKESNEKALELYPIIENMVSQSSHPLSLAIELSCAGNIIDYGVSPEGIDVEKEIRAIIAHSEKKIAREPSSIFAINDFISTIEKAHSLLFIADNAGEIVFDKLLLETIKTLYPDISIIVAVRDTPILNDALIEDAYAVGLDSSARIISSGVSTPGTVLKFASQEFLDLFYSSDMVISKGQGNFEALSDEPRDIFFLLLTKCEVIAKHVNSHVGDILLLNKVPTSQ